MGCVGADYESVTTQLFFVLHTLCIVILYRLHMDLLMLFRHILLVGGV